MTIEPGMSYTIPPGYDAWVEGNHPLVRIEVMSADKFAKAAPQQGANRPLVAARCNVLRLSREADRERRDGDSQDVSSSGRVEIAGQKERT